MIRSAAFVRAADNKTVLLQVLMHPEGIEYKELSRRQMLDMASRLIQMLVEDEHD